NAGVVGGVDHDRGAAHGGTVVLGGRTQHGGPADVDVFDSVFERAAGLGDRFTERVQIHDQQVDAVDTVFFQSLHVFRAVATSQEATVYLGVQCLDAAVEDLGRARMLGDFGDLDAGVGQQLGRTTGGKNAHPACGK